MYRVQTIGGLLNRFRTARIQSLARDEEVEIEFNGIILVVHHTSRWEDIATIYDLKALLATSGRKRVS